MGHPQEQAEDELREAVARPALLLRQEHHTQDGRQTLRLPLRLRPAEPARLQAAGLFQPYRDRPPGRGRGRVNAICSPPPKIDLIVQGILNRLPLLLRTSLEYKYEFRMFPVTC